MIVVMALRVSSCSKNFQELWNPQHPPADRRSVEAGMWRPVGPGDGICPLPFLPGPHQAHTEQLCMGIRGQGGQGALGATAPPSGTLGPLRAPATLLAQSCPQCCLMTLKTTKQPALFKIYFLILFTIIQLLFKIS